MKKFINIICHPSNIVFYFNDKVYQIILWVLGFFAVLIGIIALYSFKEKPYDANFGADVAYTIAVKEETVNIEYKDSKLTGSAYAIKANDIYIYFCKSDFYKKDFGLVMNFKENSVDIYYHLFPKKTINYDTLKIGDFTFSDVKYNNGYARINFEELIMSAVESINTEAKVTTFLNSTLHAIIMFFVVVGVSLVFAFFVNPQIKFVHRLRICIYDSLIYVVIMSFALMVGASFLQYVALILPLIYCNISFRKIVVIKR